MAHVAYLALQLLNALQIALLYALIAVAYVLFHGVTRRFNLAFGALATWASYLTIALMSGTLSRRGIPLAVLLPVAVLGGVAGAAIYGTLAGRSVRGLHAAPPLAILVATLGWAIALEEGARLSAGSRELWLAPLLDGALLQLPVAGTTLEIGAMQGFVWGTAALALAAVLALMRLSAFGRVWRAVAQDPVMARLLGVDVGGAIAASTLLAASLAGLSGALSALAYGNASFHGAFLVALKALFVAILGGLERPGGAILAALLLAILETAWSAYLPGDYRDVFVFTLLAVLLVLRPGGLLSGGGRQEPRV